jgi:hypothetical protein
MSVDEPAGAHVLREQADYKEAALSQRRATLALRLASTFVAAVREGGETR